MSLAFPRVNEYEVIQKAKQDNEIAWKTTNGFDILNKKENFNLHPKRPPQPKIDELTTIPYHWQKAETAHQLKDKEYRPQDEGKSDFVKKVKGVKTFSDGAFFKTVFVSGDDMVAEENAIR